jgi:hypothetical protein
MPAFPSPTASVAMTELPTKGVEVLGLFELLPDLLLADGRRGFVGVAFDDGIGEKRSRFWRVFDTGTSPSTYYVRWNGLSNRYRGSEGSVRRTPLQICRDSAQTLRTPPFAANTPNRRQRLVVIKIPKQRIRPIGRPTSKSMKMCLGLAGE